MIGAFQLDVAHVREMLGQVPAVGRGNEDILTPVHDQARGVHGRAQAPYVDGGGHADDGVGRRRAGAVALKAREVGPLAFCACRGGKEGGHELAAAPHLAHDLPRRGRVREHVHDGVGGGVQGGTDEAPVEDQAVGPGTRSGRLLGLVMIGPHVTDMVEAGVVAIDSAATIQTIADGIAPHPTLSEAIKDAALPALGRAIDVPNRKQTRDRTDDEHHPSLQHT
jgi:hypothetical protein